ncbi:MAG: YceI family protein [Actinomycetota bacterium]|nr:YceI family protein [Actinomycetota bacterium]
MTWTIDTAHTSVSFKARHMGLSKVRGQFSSFRGEIEGDPTDITTAKARIEIDLASVDSGNPDRDGHLKGPDFFDVENHPTMAFQSTSVVRDGDDYKVVGYLTVKGISREVELDYEHGGEATDPYGNRKVGGTLTGTIKRSDWDLTWNVPLDTGGWLVSDNVTIEIDLQVAQNQEAVVQEEATESKVSA